MIGGIRTVMGNVENLITADLLMNPFLATIRHICDKNFLDMALYLLCKEELESFFTKPFHEADRDLKTAYTRLSSMEKIPERTSRCILHYRIM
jgi:Na+/H+ antiporter NhaD/arsenite permease-like protein